MAVNKFDNSMFDAGTIGTSANQLVQLDGSAKIPAVDGSLLTGIPSSFTKSASDPVITTNPSGGVGTIWINTTSGETYCCTDATAGENIWTNVGAGTGDVSPFIFQGTAYGYSVGGDVSGTNKNSIEKYSYASGTQNGVDTADLTVARREGASSKSRTHGYHAGGYSGAYQNTIDKFNFSTEANATLSIILNIAPEL